MMKSLARLASLLIAMSSVCLWSQEKVDLETMGRIRYEGFRDSKVMELASGLMDSIGQRLTGSPNMKRANEWTRDQLTSFGLSNAHLEPWSPFGRGWSNEYINVRFSPIQRLALRAPMASFKANAFAPPSRTKKTSTNTKASSPARL